MKKILFLVLLVFIVALVGCSIDGDNGNGFHGGGDSSVSASMANEPGVISADYVDPPYDELEGQSGQSDEGQDGQPGDSYVSMPPYCLLSMDADVGCVPDYLTPTSDFVEYWLEQLTLEERIGQLFMIRLPWQATVITPRAEQLLEAIPVGGIILFGDNVTSIEQVQALTADIQTRSRLPMFISTDEEGGRVSRVGRLFDAPTPAAYDIGRQNDPAFAFEMGQEIGRRLNLLGINMNFAPVADIWSNPANAVIGNRAFGRSADAVSPMVEATIEGLHDEGIMAVVKHFPGHGDTYEDSHFYLAFHHHSLERFNTMESLPFAKGIEAGVDGVMIGHVSTPAIHGHSPLLDWMVPWIESGNLPATFSDFWLQDILRTEMGFDGLIITDALEMRALTDHFTCGQIALGAFLAGADILLMPHDPHEAFQALLDGYHAGLFCDERLNQSLVRILQAKESFQGFQTIQ